MEENWAGFVKMSKQKATGHLRIAQFWDKVNSFLTLAMIFLSTATTLCTLLPVKSYVASTVGAITTLVAAVYSALAPDNRRALHNTSSIGFRALMLKMVRVETERHYEELWREFNKEMVVEPFLPPRYQKGVDPTFSMSPEFTLLVSMKGVEVKEALQKFEVKVNVPDLKTDEIEENEANGTGPALVYRAITGLTNIVDEKLSKVA